MAERVELLKALAHPLRLRVVDRLGHLGPAPVSRLAVELDAGLPELSQGLRVLRDAGVVSVSRSGRSSVYALAPEVDRLLPLLDRIVGARPAAVSSRGGPSRTCYDHLAGPLGVALYRRLLDDRALMAEGDGTVRVLRWDELGVRRRGLTWASAIGVRMSRRHRARAASRRRAGGRARHRAVRARRDRARPGREVLAVDGDLQRLLGTP